MASILPVAGRGLVAGLAGSAAMTAFQRFVEMPLSGRRASYAPAALMTKLLPLGRTPPQARPRLNAAAHVGVGALWGVGQVALSERTGLRGQRAAATAFAVLYGGDVVTNTALGLYAPGRWSARDWAIDVTNKLVLAQAVGAIHDRLRPAAAVG
jgi:hypothetical protein